MDYQWQFLDYHGGERKDSLEDSLTVIRRRITETRRAMASLRVKLSHRDFIEPSMLDAWVDHNNTLRKLKIFEAELTYTKNLL